MIPKLGLLTTLQTRVLLEYRIVTRFRKKAMPLPSTYLVLSHQEVSSALTPKFVIGFI